MLSRARTKILSYLFLGVVCVPYESDKPKKQKTPLNKILDFRKESDATINVLYVYTILLVFPNNLSTSKHCQFYIQEIGFKTIRLYCTKQHGGSPKRKIIIDVFFFENFV